MSRRAVGVSGVSQTPFITSRGDVSTPELVFEAAQGALADAELTPNEVDAVVFASAPEVFEGIHEPDRWCADACGARGKAMFRIHTGGATGGSAAHVGVALVGSGRYHVVLVVGMQRVAEAADAQQILSTIFDPIFEADVKLNVITTVAMMAARQLAQGRLTEDHMAWIATKNFANARRNPFAHLRMSVSEDDVRSSRMLAWPLRLLHACPRSDGASAVVLVAGGYARGRRPFAWVRGLGSAADVYRIGDRMDDGGWDFAEQRALAWACSRAYAQAKIDSPREQLDVVEVYAPFSNVELASYEAMGLAARGHGWTLVEEEATAIDGDIPVCPSGGVQGANPIGATGLVRFVEAALQVGGRAGDHQVPAASRALATAAGGINQFFTAAVLAATPE